MIIIAMNVNVAFQTMLVTSNISSICTTPVIMAINAPIKAVTPISSPFGCQITKVSVNTK